VTFGKGRLILEENLTMERKELSIIGESPVLVEILPEVTHAIENIDSSMPLHLLVTEQGDSNSIDTDTYPKQIIFQKSS
jgi:hypothetical protein